MKVVKADLCCPQVINLLSEHMQDMLATSPIESVHALDLSELQQTDINIWTLYQLK